LSDGLVTSSILSIAVASAFPLGALVAIFVNYSTRIKADMASFGAGIFFSTIAFSLIDDALKVGSPIDMIIGFASGAVVFSVMNHILIKRHRDRLASQESPRGIGKARRSNPATTVIVGTFTDSIPETIFIGVIIALGLQGLTAAVIALFLGNLAATLEGAKRMQEKDKSRFDIIKKWLYVFVPVALAGPVGFYLVRPLSNDELAIIVGFAAGALMAFISEELIPQAYKRAEVHIGLSATLGFLLGFSIFYFLQ